MSGKKTVIVTGAQPGIGAGLVEEFLKQSYNVVATSLSPFQQRLKTGGETSAPPIEAYRRDAVDYRGPSEATPALSACHPAPGF